MYCMAEAAEQQSMWIQILYAKGSQSASLALCGKTLQHSGENTTFNSYFCLIVVRHSYIYIYIFNKKSLLTIPSLVLHPFVQHRSVCDEPDISTHRRLSYCILLPVGLSLHNNQSGPFVPQRPGGPRIRRSP